MCHEAFERIKAIQLTTYGWLKFKLGKLESKEAKLMLVDHVLSIASGVISGSVIFVLSATVTLLMASTQTDTLDHVQLLFPTLFTWFAVLALICILLGMTIRASAVKVLIELDAE